MAGDVFVFSFIVLSFDIVGVVDVEGGFSEGAAIEILWFYGLDIASVTGDLSQGGLFVERLRLVVHFCGDVTGLRLSYPV